MAENQLSVKIGADMRELQTVSASVQKELGAIASSATKTGVALKTVAPGANQAGQALTNLGRIAQDAPFGFVGIQNNINPLLESFQRLRAESGSTRGALKALAGSLAGGAGIGLAVSLLTSGLTLLAQNGFFATKKATDEAAESLKQYAESAKKSAEGLQKQLVSLESLVAVARGDIGTKEQQSAALEKLNKLIPDNVGHLDAQNIKTNEGIAIIKEYTKALENQATAELLTGRAATLRVKLLDDEKKLSEDLKAAVQDRAKAVKQLAAANQFGGGALANQTQTGLNTGLGQQLKNEKQILGEFRTERLKTLKELDALRKQIGQSVAGSVVLDTKDPKITKEKVVKPIKDAINDLKAVKISLPLTFDFGVQANASVTEQLGLKINTELATKSIPLTANVTVKPGNVDLSALGKAVIDQAALIEGALNSAFAGVGEAIGQAFKGGDIFGSALDIIGEGLKAIGKAVIAAGVAALVAKKAFAVLLANPATAIAAGIALTALGAALAAKAQKTKGFADGGISTGPKSGYTTTLHGTEWIFNERQMKNLNSMVAARAGGGEIVGETILRGNDIRILLRRADNSAGRLGG